MILFARKFVVLFLAAGIWGSVGGMSYSQQPSDADIAACRDRAISYLKGHLNNSIVGYQALAAVAMLKAELPPETPEIQTAIQSIMKCFHDGKYEASLEHHRYSAAISLICLANANAEQYRPQLEEIAKYLIKEQEEDGSWDYPRGVAGRGQGDTSMTQIALLGLWEASRAGITVPGTVWDKCADWLLSRQMEDGSFSYHPVADNKSEVGTHSMTAAGAGSLLVIRLHLYPQYRPQFTAEGDPGYADSQRKFGVLDETSVMEASKLTEYTPHNSMAKLDRAVSRGIKWLNTHFTMTAPTGWPIYYMYGIERLGALAGVREIGSHDWYVEGANHLISKQTAAGSWPDTPIDTPESGGITGASFGVLFLTKATAKIIDAQFGTGLMVGGRGLPTNLKEVQMQQGQLKARKSKGSFDDLLSELEKPTSDRIESVQSALVDKVLTERPAELIKQKDRLKKLARDLRPEVRQTAMWALGRTGDLRMAPLLITALKDPHPDVALEARNSLRILSRNLRGIGSSEEDQFQAAKEYQAWRNWYRTVRPYEEWDDLIRD